MTRLGRTSIAAVTAAIVAANATAASAAPTSAYAGIHGSVQGAVLGATATSGGSTLPFTGFDVSLLVAGTLVLALVGALLRRFAGENA